MKRPVRRLLIGASIVIVLIVIVLGAAIAEMFAGLRPVAGGREINGVRLIVDGFSLIGVVPIASGEIALIDAGMDRTGAAVIAELERRNLGSNAVKAVFLTHGHSDHTGAINAFPHAEVMALADEVPIIEGTRAPASPLGRLMPVSPTGVTVTRTITDGETVEVGEARVRVYAVPGHTRGSAAYLVNGLLFLGDSAQINSAGEIRPAPWAVTDDRAQNRASLAALAGRLEMERENVTAIVPAHSGPAEGLSVLTAFARRR